MAVAQATAGSFSVNPVRASLSATRRVEALTLYNSGTEAAVVQLEVRAWSQERGRDVLAPTREILATPPIFTIAPGARQVIRVGARGPASVTQELAYRLFLQEVPPPPKPGFEGLRMALRLSIPVFIAPPGAAPRLDWHAAAEPGGRVRIDVGNLGNAHVQIANMALAQGGKPVTGKQQVAAYVLARQSREWVLEPSAPIAPGAPLHLSAETDNGPVEADVALETR
ncbi:MAG TPA: molecular chaperone [Usitatibacter sp.]|jgi:fimbrial chaperone protein|nr:molecular chaperone [Usitatibacter sp.]